MARLVGLVLALALAACAGESGVSFPGKPEGSAAVALRATVYRPDGPGPFPAVVVLHGCSGIGPGQYAWAHRLVEWGYVALVVDSFRPRGFDTVCGRSAAVHPRTRALDAEAGAEYLSTLPFVRRDRIAVIGFSHGGWTAMEVGRMSAPAAAFRAAVAYYPVCPGASKPLLPTLVLVGADDDWTPPAPCQLLEQAVGDAARLQVVVYPDAVHAFDVEGLSGSVSNGHWLKYNSGAAADSFARSREFLDRWLRS